jgi:hypothetical protein
LKEFKDGGRERQTRGIDVGRSWSVVSKDVAGRELHVA